MVETFKPLTRNDKIVIFVLVFLSTFVLTLLSLAQYAGNHPSPTPAPTVSYNQGDLYAAVADYCLQHGGAEYGHGGYGWPWDFAALENKDPNIRQLPAACYTETGPSIPILVDLDTLKISPR